jgi:hypothetical protein
LASIRSIVADLKGALAVGGIEAMAETHSAAVRSCLSYRLFCGLLNLAYPATSLLELMKNLDRRIGELGVTGASKALLGTLPTSWSAEFPAEEEARIKGRPVVVFGKHGSILTPFLVAASLDRADLKMLGASYVARLGPNVAALTYPVHLPIPTLRRAARKGVLLRLGAWLTAKLDCPIDKDVARERNRTSIAGAAEHVRRGGALLIAPDARNPKAKWRSGIGLLIARLVQDGDASRDACLVPYRIWASITGVFHLLSCNPALRALGRWEYRRPIRVVFGEPIPIFAVIEETGLDPAAITDYLEAHYRGLGF